MVLGSHVAKEALLSKLTELLEQAVVWSLRTPVSYTHLLQGMCMYGFHRDTSSCCYTPILGEIKEES